MLGSPSLAWDIFALRKVDLPWFMYLYGMMGIMCMMGMTWMDPKRVHVHTGSSNHMSWEHTEKPGRLLFSIGMGGPGWPALFECR